MSDTNTRKRMTLGDLDLILKMDAERVAKLRNEAAAKGLPDPTRMPTVGDVIKQFFPNFPYNPPKAESDESRNALAKAREDAANRAYEAHDTKSDIKR